MGRKGVLGRYRRWGEREMPESDQNAPKKSALAESATGSDRASLGMTGASK
jgi:hypothetical protein